MQQSTRTQAFVINKLFILNGCPDKTNTKRRKTHGCQHETLQTLPKRHSLKIYNTNEINSDVNKSFSR